MARGAKTLCRLILMVGIDLELFGIWTLPQHVGSGGKDLNNSGHAEASCLASSPLALHHIGAGSVQRTLRDAGPSSQLLPCPAHWVWSRSVGRTCTSPAAGKRDTVTLHGTQVLVCFHTDTHARKVLQPQGLKQPWTLKPSD